MCCRWYTAAEVGTHCTTADCWITIQGIVYDLTSLLPKNPEVLNEVREKKKNSSSALMTLYFLVESNAKNVSSSDTSAIIMDLGCWVHGFLFGK